MGLEVTCSDWHRRYCPGRLIVAVENAAATIDLMTRMVGYVHLGDVAFD